MKIVKWLRLDKINTYSTGQREFLEIQWNSVKATPKPIKNFTNTSKTGYKSTQKRLDTINYRKTSQKTRFCQL